MGVVPLVSLAKIQKMNIDGKILVTGGDGFIGSALIWALNGRGREAFNVTGSLGTMEKRK